MVLPRLFARALTASFLWAGLVPILDGRRDRQATHFAGRPYALE